MEFLVAASRAVQKRNEVFLAVLTSWPEFDFHAPTFFAEIAADRGKAIVIVIRPRHAFLLGVRVVHGEYIDIQRDMPGIKGGNLGVSPMYQLDVGFVDLLAHFCGVIVHPLA